MGFLRRWRGRFVILMCFFSIFTAHQCLFGRLCAITASSRLTGRPEMVGTAAKKQDMQPMQAPHLTGFHTNFWCNTFLALQRWPFLRSLCNIHATSSLLPSSDAPSSLIYLLIHLLWWQHCFHLLHDLVLPEVHRSTAGGALFSKTSFITQLTCFRDFVTFSVQALLLCIVAGGAFSP